MRWICLVFAVITIVSFTQDLGMLQLASLRVIPPGGANSPGLLTLLFFLATMGLLLRTLKMAAKGEKEKLRIRIKELENQIQGIKKVRGQDKEKRIYPN